ncbi:hypothetical protein [Leucobacter luti]|uniref:hypothetical protein n=1 Tax=Leucobacter luti TaxID=340320 RepID=UPI003D0897DD
MSDSSGPTMSLHDALQGVLDEQAGVDVNGSGVRVAGYVAAVIYARPDGSTGLTVLAPYPEAETVYELLGHARTLVQNDLPVLVEDHTDTDAEPHLTRRE